MKELEGPLSDCFLGSLGEPTDHREYRDNDDKGIIPSARGRKLQNDRPLDVGDDFGRSVWQAAIRCSARLLVYALCVARTHLPSYECQNKEFTTILIKKFVGKVA